MPLNCSNQFPLTEVLYADLKKNQYPEVIVFLSLCVAMCITMVVLFIEASIYVFRFHNNKHQKYRIIFLLALQPVVGWTSLLAILVPRSTLLDEFVASIYLSFCIVMFMNLLLEYFGGTTKLLEDMSDKHLVFGTPPCCCCCICCKVPFKKKSLRIAVSFALQTAIIRPIVLFVAAVLWSDGKMAPGDEGSQNSGTFVVQVFSSISTLLGIWGLQIVYRATMEMLPMFRVKLKFATLQLTFVTLNLQSFILSILGKNGIPECDGSRGPLLRGSRLNHFLLVLEMFLICVLSRFAYRRQEAKNMSEYHLEDARTNMKDEKEVTGHDNFVDISKI